MRIIKHYIDHNILKIMYNDVTECCEKLVNKDFNISENYLRANVIYDELREYLYNIDSLKDELHKLLEEESALDKDLR